MKYLSSAPSNIALIKYMGKDKAEINTPTNTSFSYTLDHLRTYVELEVLKNKESFWQPLKTSEFLTKEEITSLNEIELNDKSQKRFLQHLERMKNKWGIKKNFIVRSASNFPSDCGLASSASSFAALTLTFYEYLKNKTDLDVQYQDLVNISRAASGSSCRSFHSPWVSWNGESVEKMDFENNELIHFSVVVDGEKKEVSSSEAHQRVKSSLLFDGRVKRAEKRFENLKLALLNHDWKKAFDVTWAEFWDMHALFETSVPTFGYMNSNSVLVLQLVKDFWKIKKDGPLVTMDAGPNVHLLFRKDQEALAKELLLKLKQNFQVMDHFPGERQ